MKRLAGMVGAVAVGAAVFTVIDTETQARVDPLILTYIAAVYTLGIVVMLAWTRKWSTIGVGLLATMTGDALLYARLSHILPFPNGQWPLDIVRSCFIVGGSYLLVGMVLWAKAQRDGDDAMMLTDEVP